MTVDLTGGLDPEREEVFAAAPENPEMRDSVSMWISDDQGYFGIPRIGIEAAGRPWDEHLYQAQMGFADGRIFLNHGSGATHPARDEAGRPYILGAGPLEFRCLEPFARWSTTFKGEMLATTVQQLIETPKSQVTGGSVQAEFEVVTTMAAPPWIQGSLLLEAKALLDGGVEGGLMGGPRYEQLFRCEGSVKVDVETHSFSGQGLRIRRQGVRELAEFWGHAWQSAIFPSGRAFGYITYPPRVDGRLTFNEGYLLENDGGEMIPARVLEAPWLRRLVPHGEDVPVVFETEKGITRIEGETVIPIFDTFKPQMPDFPVLVQAGVRYCWDGEETYGMMERSSLKHLVEWPAT